MATIEEKIARIDKKIEATQKKFDKRMEWFMRDSNISPKEEKALARVEASMDKLRDRKDALNAKRGVFEFDDDEGSEVTINTGKDMGEAKYFTDDYFKGKFKQSVKDWSQDGGIALNSVRTYMIAEESPAGLSVADVVKIVGMIFPPAKFLGPALEIGQLIEKGFNSALNARSTKPSLNEIHKSWGDALVRLGSSNMDDAYDKFVTQWKSANKVPSDVEEAWTNFFGPACQNYAKNNLPGSNEVQRQFMAKILSTVEDSYDWDDEAGQAEVSIYHLEGVGSFSSPKGQLDDVSEQLMKAVKTVFKGAKVIDLPVKLIFSIENTNGAELCEITRRSNKPGDTGFRKTDGSSSVFDTFMKKKAYEKVKVSHLSYDGY